MSELIYVHGISPIPNVLQDNFHIFFRFLELRKTCNIKRKIAVVIADDWGALWAPQSSAMTSLGSRCQNLHYDTPKRAHQKTPNSYAGATMRSRSRCTQLPFLQRKIQHFLALYHIYLCLYKTLYFIGLDTV